MKTPIRQDFKNFALLSYFLGGLIVLLSGLFFRVGVLYGALVAGYGASFIAMASGIRRFKKWAWYVGVVLVLPASVLGAVVGLAAAAASGGGGQMFLGAGGLFAVYVGWVLLAKPARKAYKRFCENPPPEPRTRRQRLLKQEEPVDGKEEA